MLLWDIPLKQCIRALKGHTDAVSGVIFSADGSCIISGSRDRAIRLWQVQRDSATILSTVSSGHDDDVDTIALSRDGRMLASASQDTTTVKLWNVSCGAELARLTGHTQRIACMRFSPDGRLLATCSQSSGDGTVRVWNIVTCRGASAAIVKIAYNNEFSDVRSIGWNRVSRSIIIASRNGISTLAVWNVTNSSGLKRGNLDIIAGCLPLARFARNVIRYSPDGTMVATTLVKSFEFELQSTLIATGTRQCVVVVYNVAGGESFLMEGHTKDVTDVAFSPADSTLLLTTSKDTTALLWRLQGQHAMVTQTMNHDYPVCSGVISADGSCIVTSDSRGLVQLWEVADSRLDGVGACVSTARIELEGPACDPDRSMTFVRMTRDCGTVVLAVGSKAVGSLDVPVQVWRRGSTMGNWSCQLKLEHTSSVSSIALSHDDKLVASGTCYCEVRSRLYHSLRVCWCFLWVGEPAKHYNNNNIIFRVTLILP